MGIMPKTETIRCKMINSPACARLQLKRMDRKIASAMDRWDRMTDRAVNAISP